jgi:hypothetical protein
MAEQGIKDDGVEILEKARRVDDAFGLDFEQAKIEGLQKGHDVWLELMFICRATFSIASIVAPYQQYPYGKSQKKAPYGTLLGQNEDLRKQLDLTTMYDAVLNTAIIWKHIWNKVSVE